MSIAAFYRNYVPFVQAYSYNQSGRPVEVQTPPTWVKVNVQPYKQGLQFDLTQTGIISVSYTHLTLPTICSV